jgi:thymidylate kinase
VSETLYILEGVDGVGKDVFARWLRKITGAPILHDVPMKGIAEFPERIEVEEKVRYFILKSLDWRKTDLIVKRFFATYKVYNELFNRGNRFEYFDLEKDFPKDCVLIFYLKAPEKLLKERLEKRGDDYVSAEELATVSSLFDKYIAELEKIYRVVRVNSYTAVGDLEEYVSEFGEKVYSEDWDALTQELTCLTFKLSQPELFHLKINGSNGSKGTNGTHGEVENPDHRVFLRFEKEVARRLKETPTTRRAYIPAYTVEDVLSKSPPCIIGVQFLIRNSRLRCIVFLRSFDVRKYFASDVGFFASLCKRLAKRLNLEGYEIYLNIGSAHYYEEVGGR